MFEFILFGFVGAVVFFLVAFLWGSIAAAWWTPVTVDPASGHRILHYSWVTRACCLVITFGPALGVLTLAVGLARSGPSHDVTAYALVYALSVWAAFFFLIGLPQVLETMFVRVEVSPEGITKDSPWSRRRSLRWDEVIEVYHAYGWGALVFVGPRRRKIRAPWWLVGQRFLVDAMRLHLDPCQYEKAEKMIDFMLHQGSRKEAFVTARRELPAADTPPRPTPVASREEHVKTVQTAVKSEQPRVSPQPVLTARLELVPFTLELILAEINDRHRLEQLLDARVPKAWPPPFNDSSTQAFFLTQITEDPDAVGWWGWYFILRRPESRVLIGNGGFKGRPNAEGVVETGYSVLAEFHKQGYGSEAIAGLVRWAFSHPEVTAVIAETLPNLHASMRLLEKLGFAQTGSGSEEGSVRYTLARKDWRG
jgi:RimJ/RimL family protein N-acetyltransferase